MEIKIKILSITNKAFIELYSLTQFKTRSQLDKNRDQKDLNVGLSNHDELSALQTQHFYCSI